MDLDTLHKPDTQLKKITKPNTSLLVFYTNTICIILNKIQLKISRELNYTPASSLRKMIKLASYKYTMNYPGLKIKNLLILNTFIIHIFKFCLSKISMHFLSL